MTNWADGTFYVAERNSYFGVFSAQDSRRLRDRIVASCAKPHPDAKANAALFSAAPSLYAALEACVDLMEGEGFGGPLMDSARLALSKARSQPIPEGGEK